jgi:signal transduction histidine kinase/DNA-binding response OmpR family regulator
MTNNLSIKQKLALIGIIPLLMFFYLSAILISNEYNKKIEMQDMSSFMTLTKNALALADSLQNERGYSMCFTKTKGKELLLEKNKQREITNKLMTPFMKIKYSKLKHELEIIEDQLKALKKIRKKVDSLQLTSLAIKNIYSNIIKNLMAIPSHLKTKDTKLIVLDELLFDISNIKNEASLERTIFNSVILTSKFNINSFSSMVYASSKQKYHLSNFDKGVYGDIKEFYTQKIMDQSFFEVQKLRNKATEVIKNSINNQLNLNISSKEWCSIATRRLDILKQIEDKTLEIFQKTIDEKYEEINSSFYSFLLLLSIITIISYLLARKSINDLNISLKNLDDGLNRFFEFLNHKHRKVKLIDIQGDDEISKMSNMVNENILIIENDILNDKALIEYLSNNIEKIKSENFDIDSIDIQTTNPILKDLRININELIVILKTKAIELKEYKENLEQIIIIKTHELEKLNKNLEDKVSEKTKEITDSKDILEDERNRLANFTDFLSKLNSVDISYLCNNTLKHLVKVSSSLFGLMYLKQEDNSLKLISTSCLDGNHLNINLAVLEKMGVISDAMKDNKWISIENIEKDSLVLLDISIAKLSFSSFYVIPLSFQDKGLGVIVLASHSKIDKSEIESYKKALENALNNAVSYNLIQKQRLSLESANMELLRADKLKSEFLANMSHELRTPLNSVIGFSSILMKNKKGNLEDKQLSQIDKINKNGNHLLGLINDILDLSKIEAGKIEIDYIKIDIISIVKNTIDMLQGQAHNKSILLTFSNKSEQESIQILLDDNKFRQVLVNLVGNALKFVESGSGKVDVDLSLKDEFIKIDIVDNGIGIEEDKLDLIFEAFRQADGSTTRNYGGTGLGLTISKSIIELLGGKIEVSSKVGKGSVFTIYLPTDKDKSNINDTSLESHLDLKVKKMDINKILVVDDTSDSREIIKEYIKDLENIELVFACDGEEAYNKALEVQPSLIITDIMMPRLNGWQLIDKLNANKDLQNIPVIVVSNVSNEAKAFSLGAIDCLHKPISRDDLLATFKKNFKGIENSILIVDDEVDIIDMMKDILYDEVKYIETASNGKEALSVLDRGFYPDLIYLDLMMPQMDGFQFLEIVKHHDKYKYLPVVVVSAKDLSLNEKNKLHNMNVKVISKGNDISKEIKKSLKVD